MTNEELKLLQKVQLSLMCLVHKICVENNIRYYIIGGTALGSKRHGGFIPWDIDMDIAMPREDYERFKKLGLKGLDPRLTYHDYSNTKNMFSPHALVCINGTVLREKRDTIGKRDVEGVFLDIFPLDTAPSDPKLQQKQAKQIATTRMLDARKIGRLFRNSKKERLIKKIVVMLMKPISFKLIGKTREKIMRKYENCGSGLICSMTSHYSYQKQLMPFEVYGTPTLVDFDGYKFFAPEKLEEYLTKIFGDYMVLPDEKSRTELLNHFTEVYIPEELKDGLN